MSDYKILRNNLSADSFPLRDVLIVIIVLKEFDILPQETLVLKLKVYANWNWKQYTIGL